MENKPKTLTYSVLATKEGIEFLNDYVLPHCEHLHNYGAELDEDTGAIELEYFSVEGSPFDGKIIGLDLFGGVYGNCPVPIHLLLLKPRKFNGELVRFVPEGFEDLDLF